jgi:hypothetical protein
MLTALLLTSTLVWTEVGTKRALVCDLAELEPCLAQLSPSVRSQLPTSMAAVIQNMGLRSAMVLPLNDARVAGLVLQNASAPVQSPSAFLDGESHALSLMRQTELTLWHELGHLHNLALRGDALPGELSPYQHEWLADLYLVWRSVRESGELTLAWQQYHRRNLEVLADTANLSHWSSPILSQVLARYDVSTLLGFADYRDFVQDCYSSLSLLSQDELAEFSSLLQRTFGPGTVQPLPGYMFWRRPALGHLLRPTLTALVGEASAEGWLARQGMLPKS